MWNKIRLSWSLAVVCLCGALVIAAANPAGAVPYSKKPIYDGFNLTTGAVPNLPLQQQRRYRLPD